MLVTFLEWFCQNRHILHTLFLVLLKLAHFQGPALSYASRLLYTSTRYICPSEPMVNLAFATLTCGGVGVHLGDAA